MNSVLRDPLDPNRYLVGTIAETGAVVSHTTLYYVHAESVCQGRPCVVHNPSQHALRLWPLVWRNDVQNFERICSHGIGHPDPDTLAYNDNPGIHACDGCCHQSEQEN